MELQYKDMRKGYLDSAGGKLIQSTNFTPSEALEVYKLIEQLMKKQDEITAEFRKLAYSHAELDEKGLPKTREDHMGRPVPNDFIKKDTEAWDKAVIEFGEQTFTIQSNFRIPLKKLDGIKFTPFEMIALEPILSTEGGTIHEIKKTS